MCDIRTIIHNNKTYMSLDDIKRSGMNDEYFVGCKSIRGCVDKHNLNGLVVYVSNDKIYSKNYKKAQVYVEDDYVNDNLLNRKRKNNEIEETIETTRKRRKECNDIEDAAILLLEESEMFRDENNKVMEIEVRGDRTMDKILFKASDIGKAFNYNRINDVVKDVKSDYEYGTHFTYVRTDFKRPRNSGNNKELFLTYLGVLKVLFCSRGKRGDKFQVWAATKLFTIQMGKQDEKDELAAELIGVDKKAVINVFKRSCGSIPCVYLFKIGTVGKMRKHFNLSKFSNDDDIVYKYGMTCDMGRRTNEHTKAFTKLNGNEFGLEMFSYIDNSFISTAESHIRQYFTGFDLNVEDDKYHELIVVNKEQYTIVKQLYNDMYIQYAGKNKDLIQQVQTIESRYRNAMESADMRNQNLLKDMELRMKENELKYLRRFYDMNSI